MEEKIKLTFFQRLPPKDGYSVEYIFKDVRNRLSPFFDIKTVISKYPNTGFFPRLYNIIEAFFHQNQVNHVIGDVHYLVFLLRKKKTILTILDCDFLNHSKGLSHFILKHFWLTIPVKKSQFITAISHATKRDIVKYTNCDPEKVKVIPVAIAPVFKHKPKVFNAEKPILLHIGMAPNKNLDRVMEAVAGMNIRMSIIGQLSEQSIQKLEALNIEYTNHWGLTQLEVVEKYCECDVMVFASTYEGFGMPILEAQATGRVVVTSNVSSMPEVSGEAACLVNPYDISAIRHGILRVIEDAEYRNTLIEKGLENVKKYDADYIANMYASLHREVYAQSAQSPQYLSEKLLKKA